MALELSWFQFKGKRIAWRPKLHLFQKYVLYVPLHNNVLLAEWQQAYMGKMRRYEGDGGVAYWLGQDSNLQESDQDEYNDPQDQDETKTVTTLSLVVIVIFMDNQFAGNSYCIVFVLSSVLLHKHATFVVGRAYNRRNYSAR